MRLKLVFIDGPLPTQPRRKLAAMRAVVDKVALARRVPVHEVTGQFLNRKAAHARHEAMYHARHELGQSFPEIGRFFNRDHSTVMYGVRKHAERLAAG